MGLIKPVEMASLVEERRGLVVSKEIEIEIEGEEDTRYCRRRMFFNLKSVPIFFAICKEELLLLVGNWPE